MLERAGWPIGGPPNERALRRRAAAGGIARALVSDPHRLGRRPNGNPTARRGAVLEILREVHEGVDAGDRHHDGASAHGDRLVTIEAGASPPTVLRPAEEDNGRWSSKTPPPGSAAAPQHGRETLV